MDVRNIVIAALGVAVLVLGALLVSDRDGSGTPPKDRALETPDDLEAVRVLDVVLDHENRRHIDVFLERPVGRERVGESLAKPAARIEPRTGGVWRWQGDNILRFTATDRLESATRYRLELLPENFLGPGQAFASVSEFEVVTDAFQVDRVAVHEEPLPEGGGHVRLRGTLFFNHAVDGRELLPRMVLDDPESPTPIELELETPWPTKNPTFVSAPIRKGTSERTLTLRIADDLTSAQGNVALAEPFGHPIPLGSRDRLSVRNVRSRPGEETSRIELDLSSPIDPAVAKRHLRVEPEVEFELHAERNTLVLEGAFAPEGRYRVFLGDELTATDGSRLRESWKTDVQLAALEPTVDFESRGLFLAARGSRNIGLVTVNVPKVDVTIERVYRNNVPFLLENDRYLVWNDHAGYRSLRHVYGDVIASETLEIAGPRNTTRKTALALDHHLGDAEPGLYRIVVGQTGGGHRRAQRWVLITDLGLVAKTSGDEVLVWVSSFEDLSPVVGARVTVLSRQNQVIHSGRTDARGMLHVTDLAESLEQSSIGLILAERGDDWTFLPGDQTRVDLSGFDVAGADGPHASFDAYLYGERDLYRPGEVVRGVALLRDRSLGIPARMPLRLIHIDPQGAERVTQQIEADETGLAEYSLELPAYERTGTHRLELRVATGRVGSREIQVEEFVPDRIEVEIETGERAPGPGDALAFDVRSDYLFGAPAAGLAVDARVRLEPTPFRPDGYAGFRFANDERRFDALDVFRRQAKLDEAGRIRLETELPQGLLPASSLTAVITARVQEQGGRGVSARRRLAVHPFPYYVGLRRAGDGHAEPNEAIRFEYVAVSKDGDETKSGALRAEVYVDRWNTVLRRTAHGTYKYESVRDSERVAEIPVAAGATRGSFEFTPREFGRYRVQLTDPETRASTQLDFYASGWGYAPWAIEDPTRIELDLDREVYASGDTAKVQVRAPFAGTLLLTVERDGVHEKIVQRLDGNTAEIAVPIRAAYRPNVYVTATVVRAVDDLPVGGVARAFGAVAIEVDRARHRLPVELALPEQARAHERVVLEARTEPGATVTIAAVDEGILQLIGQPTPDPFEHFYRRLGLAVQTFDTFSLLFPEVDVENAAAGGGRAKLARTELVRTEGIRRVEPVSFWSGARRADARGRVRFEVALPEYQGSLRVMAVASRGDDFGAAADFVPVRDPIVLLPTWPRFVGVDDRLKLPITVRNDTGGGEPIRLGLETSGPVELLAPESGTLALEIPTGQERTGHFEVATGRGDAPVELTLRAEGNGVSTRSHVALGRLRADLPRQTVERVGRLGARTTTIESPDRLRKEGRKRTLVVSRFPLVSYAGRLASLVRYPYGCLEQTVSRAFPLVHLGTLAREIEPELFETHDPDTMVDLAIHRVLPHALPQGGFGLWMNADSPDPWASIYATHFLIEAQRAGHAVPTPALDRALEFVAGQARSRSGLSTLARERAAYALFVLARADRPDVASMDYFREKERARLAPASRALIAAAYAMAGSEAGVEELLRGDFALPDGARDTGGNYASPLRNRALGLLALLDARPEDPRITELARAIARDASELTVWSTQEASFALLALGQLFARQDASPPLSGTLRIGGADIGRFEGGTRRWTELPDGPVVFEPDADPTGDGDSDDGAPNTARAAYYSLSERGVPRDDTFRTESNGIEIERTWTGPEGRDLASGFVQGDLVRASVRIRATGARVENVVIEHLLPAGFEVENPRLATSGAERGDARSVDIRDDRALVFVDLRDRKWRSYTVEVRAVLPGRYHVPPVQAEAMYDPTLRAVGERGVVEIREAR